MAGKHWMAKAFANAHGQLHKALGIAKGQKIPRDRLEEAVKQGGVNGRRAQAVLNANPLR